VALKKPFGALSSGYYGPTIVLKLIPFFPKDSPKVIGDFEPEHPGSHFANWRYRFDDWSVQFEVFAPYVTPGIEKSDRIAGTIYGCDIRAFVPVASTHA
jgi:hypothetical protein